MSNPETDFVKAEREIETFTHPFSKTMLDSM